MPLYEYECESCGHRFERIQKFSDPPLETCPKCGGKLHKLISSPAIQFKGSGWYITDYSKKGSSGESGSKTDSGDSAKKSDSSSSDKSSTSSTSDAKPAPSSGSSTSTDSKPTKT